MKQLKGFTLVELLVVISIIALLLAILMPSLQTAREQAKAVICSSNQRSLITAYITYASANNDNLVSGDVAIGNSWSSSNWIMPPRKDNGVYAYGAGEDVTLEERYNGIKAGKLWPYLETLKVYNCPSDDRQKRGTSLGNSDAYKMYVSYMIQAGLNAQEQKPNTASYAGYAVKKFSDTKRPSETYVFVETYYDGAVANCHLGGFPLAPYNNVDSWWSIMSIWHKDTYTLSFMDGSVNKFKCKDRRTIEFSKSRGAGSYIQPDNPDLEFMVAGYAVELPRQRRR